MGPEPPADVVLSIERVSRRFGRRTIFAEVSGSVRSGGALVIAGRNGSGKSTLMRIIAGLLPPSAGRVGVCASGQDLDALSRRAVIGAVAPDLQLYGELTGAENLRFFAELRGMPLERDRLAALLERVGLKGRGRELVRNYSSGMRQRLKYAFALLHEPQLLLLDEPTANLDTDGVRMVESVLDEQRRRGAVVIATNEPRELAWGDAVVDLDRAQPASR